MARYIFTNERYDTKLNQETYNKFLRFKDIFFNKGKSIFDENLNLFDNDEVFLEFEERIIKKHDSSSNGSIEKYMKQLKGSSSKTKHFFANLVWLYNFPIYDMKPETKKNEIKTYLYSSKYSEELLNDFIPEKGFASYGATRNHKYFSICYIYFFVKDIIKESGEYIETLNKIKVYERINEICTIYSNTINLVPPLHMLKFLFNPDYYEPIVNTLGKRNIVKHFLDRVDDDKLDDDLYSIRKNQFGFDNSLYAVLYGEGTNLDYVQYKKIKVKKNIEKSIDSKFNFSLSSNTKSENERIEDYKIKLINGEKAERLVYDNIIKYLTPMEKAELITAIYKRFEKNYTIDRISQNIDKIIHYSKNFDSNSPFDLITYANDDLLFIEVKSTVSNEIIFSRNEILFAFMNKDNYEVRVVKENNIYLLDLENTIDEIYEFLNNRTNWCCKSFVIHLDI